MNRLVWPFLAPLAGVLLAHPALAATPAPLPPGKPAGVHEAMSRSSANLLTYGTYAVALGIGVWIFSVTSVGSSISTH